MPPTDPLIYRFYELVLINGPAWKELIQEEFSDGIMSAMTIQIESESIQSPSLHAGARCRPANPYVEETSE